MHRPSCIEAAASRLERRFPDLPRSRALHLASLASGFRSWQQASALGARPELSDGERRGKLFAWASPLGLEAPAELALQLLDRQPKPALQLVLLPAGPLDPASVPIGAALWLPRGVLPPAGWPDHHDVRSFELLASVASAVRRGEQTAARRLCWQLAGAFAGLAPSGDGWELDWHSVPSLPDLETQTSVEELESLMSPGLSAPQLTRKLPRSLRLLFDPSFLKSVAAGRPNEQSSGQPRGMAHALSPAVQQALHGGLAKQLLGAAGAAPDVALQPFQLGMLEFILGVVHQRERGSWQQREMQVRIFPWLGQIPSAPLSSLVLADLLPAPDRPSAAGRYLLETMRRGRPALDALPPPAGDIAELLASPGTAAIWPGPAGEGRAWSEATLALIEHELRAGAGLQVPLRLSGDLPPPWRVSLAGLPGLQWQ